MNLSRGETSLIQFILYSFVGVIACAIDLTVFFLFIRFFGTPLILATSLSFIVATLVNFTLCYKFIFSVSAKRLLDQIVRTGFIALIGLVLNSSLFGLLITYTDLPIFWAKILVVPIVMVWNFGARRAFVYSSELHPTATVFLSKLLTRLFLFRESKKS